MIVVNGRLWIIRRGPLSSDPTVVPTAAMTFAPVAPRRTRCELGAEGGEDDG